MLIHKILIVALALLPLTANAQTCQQGSITSTTPTNRFTDHANGTVTDKETGLMWKKCHESQTWIEWDFNGFSGAGCADRPDKTYTWREALEQAQTLNSAGGFAGHTDWRVPNINELASIVEEACFDPAINLSVFGEAPLLSDDLWLSVWSSSPADYDDSAWLMEFSSGFNSAREKSTGLYVRLVRDAH
ncbi:MAG: DUF1566 domain-containing protein [Candidatus Thiothrix putei]|uniref:DUF1566 domain-containing protein n=1 Tax=Candidatus Thiothrix putei TaxID=3080811 RepID=A0AA95HBP9_9GAMM|nr:MAG: DUF1566 domain-containing protein [Candidatus Thiothrix putei]